MRQALLAAKPRTIAPAMGLRDFARRRTTPEQRKRLRRLAQWPPVRGVRLGSLRRTRPISRNYGFERGTPIDRFYIEQFLADHQQAIQGHVLEIGDDEYTRAYGKDKVEQVDVLHAGPDNPQATIVADLADAPQIPDGTFNCVICTQTLLLIYDVQAAVKTLHRILAPGGVALVTVPGVSRICRDEADEWGDYWRFTTDSATRLFADEFGPDNVTTRAYGNVLAATAMLHGLAAEEIGDKKLNDRDRDFEVLIGVSARRPE
jgi:SAM-dependent methyltransferase